MKAQFRGTAWHRRASTGGDFRFTGAPAPGAETKTLLLSSVSVARLSLLMVSERFAEA